MRAWLTAVLVIATLAACVAVAVARSPLRQAAAIIRVAPPFAVAPIRNDVAAPNWPAMVVPVGEIDVAAPSAGGRIAEVAVRLGDRVEAGQTIARLDPARARREITEAQARLAARMAEGRQAAARRAQARDRLARIERLGTVVAEAERAEAELALQSAQADVDRSSAEIRAQRVATEHLEATLRDTTIVAPISGEVSARLLDAGAQVGGGGSIVRLVGDGRLLRLAVGPDADIPRLGETIAVRCGLRDLGAEVTHIAPHVDPAARVIWMEARPSDAVELRVGDSCTAMPNGGQPLGPHAIGPGRGAIPADRPH